MSNLATEHEVYERVYQSIKKGVVFHEFKSGQHLLIVELAQKLGVSATPVRETLNRLVAEGLIKLVPKSGFFMKHLREEEIRDLYSFYQLLINWSASVLEKDAQRQWGARLNMASSIDKLSRQVPPDAESLITITNNLFIQLAELTMNSEVRRQVDNINDQLHYVRHCEVDFFEREKINDSARELLSICQLCEERCYKELRQALDSYFKLRLDFLQAMLTMQIE